MDRDPGPEGIPGSMRKTNNFGPSHSSGDYDLKNRSRKSSKDHISDFDRYHMLTFNS
jgi:hypothetical protein